MRKPFPAKKDSLNVASASPVGDKVEFQAAFSSVQAAYPGVALTYIGTDGVEHFFQKFGDKIAYVVPVSAGWTAR